MIRIVEAPERAKVDGWAITMPSKAGSPIEWAHNIGPFETPEQARAFASEWGCEGATIVPLINPGFSARALARFEQVRDERGFF